MELSSTNKPFILKDIPFCEKKENRSKDLSYFILFYLLHYN